MLVALLLHYALTLFQYKNIWRAINDVKKQHPNMVIATVPSSTSKLKLKAWVLVAIDPNTSLIKEYQYLFGFSVFAKFKELKSVINRNILQLKRNDLPNKYVYKAHMNMINNYKEEYHGNIN